MTEAARQHIDVRDEGEVTVVTFRDARILDEITIAEIGQELFSLVEDEQRQNLLLNLGRVEFLSSAALGKLITLRRKVNDANGYLKLCNIQPDTFEVFNVSKLNTFFKIFDTEASAIATF